MNTAAHQEIPFHFHGAGFYGLCQIIQNLVGYFLMKCPLIAVRPEVKLEGLEFYAESIRNVSDPNRCKIRLSCARTEAGKFRAFKLNFVIPCQLRIWKDFKMF